MSSDSYVNLDSVGSVLNVENGLVYPMLVNGTADLDDDGVHLNDVEEEWVDGLSNEDAETVLTTSYNLQLVWPD
tara:strand:- start:61 stop:282 length:222 start_codon:yes stop_codon:yes gene_type:complete